MNSGTDTHTPTQKRKYSRRSPTVIEAGPDAIDLHVGQRIRLRRNILGTTQSELADAIGVTCQQVQKYERGFNRVSASKLFRVAKTLRVPVSFFFVGLEEDPDHDDPLQDNEFLGLGGLFLKMSPDQRKMLINFVGTMRHG